MKTDSGLRFYGAHLSLSLSLSPSWLYPPIPYVVSLCVALGSYHLCKQLIDAREVVLRQRSEQSDRIASRRKICESYR